MRVKRYEHGSENSYADAKGVSQKTSPLYMKPFSRWVWHDAFCKPRYLIMSNSTCQKNAVSACTLTLFQAYLPWISIVPLKSELKNVVREKECEISIR